MKYKLTETTKQVNGVTLYQIQALKDFGDVKAGDLGGWIEKESNLSQEGDCWVFGNAEVYGSARVYDNARVSGDAEVFGNAEVFGYAQVSENAWVYDNAKVYDIAKVSGNTRVYGDAKVGQSMYVKFGRTTTDLTVDLISNIESQTSLKTINNEVYCYKHVREDLTSLHDPEFQYKVNEWVEVDKPDLSNNSCASGLHVSNAQYWNNRGGDKVLFCKVQLEDVIAVQEGKIRCKKLFVIGVCDGLVY